MLDDADAFLSSDLRPVTFTSRSVLHVGKFYPPHPGGMESHLKTLCKALSRHIDVQALVNADGMRRSEIADGKVRVIKVGNWLTFLRAPVSPSLVTELRRSRHDLVHIHWPNPAAALAYLVAEPKSPLVITWHSDVVRQRRTSRMFEPILQRFLRRCSAVIVSSTRYANSSTALREHASKIRTVPFGIDPASSKCELSLVNDIKARYGNKIVLTVGRLVYYKGLHHLIRAMRDIPDTTLVIVGSGPLRAALEELAFFSGVRQRVVFASNVEDVAPYYQACDVFVLASIARSEAFGLVQLEAMMAGKPVVNTALDSGVPHVSIDGVTGITVPPGNPRSLAAAITRLLGDPELCRQYGNAARERVRKEFSLELMVARTLDVYREVLTPRAMPSAANIEALRTWGLSSSASGR